MHQLFRMISLSMTLSLACVLSPALQARTITIVPKWEVGKTYAIVMTTEQNMTMPMGNTQSQMNTLMKLYTTISVQEASEADSNTITTRYTRVIMDVDAMGQQIHYDTDQPDPASPMQLLDKLTEIELDMTVNEDNAVTNVEGMESIANLVEGNPPLQEMIEGMFNKEFFKSMAQSGFYKLPEEPVAIGERWNFSQAFPMGKAGEMMIQGSYTLRGITQHQGYECAVLDVSANMEGKLNVGMPMRLKQAKMDGTVYFALNIGQTVDSTIEQNMELLMKSPGSEQEMTIQSEQIIQYTLSELRD